MLIGVDVELKEVVSCQLVDLGLIFADCVLHLDALLISVGVETTPKILYFGDPLLVGCVRRNSSIHIVSERDEVLKLFHCRGVYLL